MFWVVRFDPLDNESFGRKIGFGNEINIALFMDGNAADEFFELKLPGIAGGFDSKIEHNG